MLRLTASLALSGFAIFIPTLAHAHVSVASGLGLANTTQEITFSVGHGCSGADTLAVSVEIPAGVSSVRPETSDFGQVDVQTDEAGSVRLVIWKKVEAAALEADTQFYKLAVRLKIPDAPFSTLYFPAHQTCRAADGTTTLVDWVGIDEPEGCIDSGGRVPGAIGRTMPRPPSHLRRRGPDFSGQVRIVSLRRPRGPVAAPDLF